MAERRRYTEQDKAVALAAYETCGNVVKAARLCNVNRRTLASWVAGAGVNDDVAVKCQVKKGEIADRLEDLVHMLIDAIPGKIGDANMQSVATSLGIAIDKMRLLRGEPNTITQSQHTSREERVEAILAFVTGGGLEPALQPDRLALPEGDAAGPDDLNEEG